MRRGQLAGKSVKKHINEASNGNSVFFSTLPSWKTVGLRIQDVIELLIRSLNASGTSVSIVLAVAPSDHTTPGLKLLALDTNYG